MAPPLANTALVELSTSRGSGREMPRSRGNGQGTAAFHFVMWRTYLFCMLDLFLEIAARLCCYRRQPGWRVACRMFAGGGGGGIVREGRGAGGFESLGFMAAIKS